MALRAFQLVEVLGKMVPPADVPRHKIEAVDCWGNDLYVGTLSGIVVHYLLEHGESPTGKVTCRTMQKGKLSLPAPQKDKKIECLMVIPSQRKLLVLAGGCVSVLSMDDVKERAGPIKNIQQICRDDGVEINTRVVNITATRKKLLGIFHYEFFGSLNPQKGTRDLEEEKHREVVCMARDGNSLCVAQRNQYNIINLVDGEVNEVFPFTDDTMPLIKYVGSNEFLLINTFGDDSTTMGMFINGTGTPVRPPVRWPFRPKAAALNHPYLVIMGEEGSIVVHSLLDQKEKQVINYPDGKLLCDSSGKIIVAGDNRISLLVPVSFTSQIDELLGEERVEEALELAEVTFSSSNLDLDAEEFQRQREDMLALQRRAGLTYLKMNRFADGFDLLAASNTDPREMIAIFPNLLPKSSSYSNTVSTTGISDISQIVKNRDGLKDAQKALANFLNIMRSDHVPREWAADIDTVLAILYGILSPSKLVTFVNRPHAVVLEDASHHLQKHGRYHVVALLYTQSESPRQALEIWRRLAAGEIQDEGFPGLDFAIDYLTTVTVTVEAHPDDRDAIVNAIYVHAEWMLKKDPLAVRVFTGRTREEHNNLFRADTVLEFLRPFGAAPVAAYLEYLVHVVKNETERYHTRLAMLHLETVQRKMIEESARIQAKSLDPKDPESWSPDFLVLRAKLKKMLQKSNFYRVDVLLERVRHTELFNERAILHGKSGEHQLAIELLVHKLHDFAAAEEYCIEISVGLDRKTREKVFLTLLKVYLLPSATGKLHTDEAINLLNNNATDLDTLEVLALIPKYWGLGVIDRFLRRSLRRSIHTQRESRIMAGLARQEHIQQRAEWVRLTSQPTVVTDNTDCYVCGRTFVDADDNMVIDVTNHCPRCNQCPKSQRSTRRGGERERGALF
eukprot:m.261755 g.261755  ORF g.261755 m.261755 type:complete len:903 (+) comp43078_c0_seq1:282-2990(+)